MEIRGNAAILVTEDIKALRAACKLFLLSEQFKKDRNIWSEARAAAATFVQLADRILAAQEP